MKKTAILASAFVSVAAFSFVSSCGTTKHSTPPAPVAAQAKPAQAAPAPAHNASIKAETLEPYSCGTIERLHTFQGLFLASQPSADDLRHAKEGGIKTVMSLRPASELKEFDEPALVHELGMEFVNIGFAGPDTLTDEVIDQARAVLNDPAKRPMMVHCHSGNRVGAIWLAHRVLDGGLTWDAALAEAKEVGLKTPTLEARVQKYVDSHRK